MLRKSYILIVIILAALLLVPLIFSLITQTYTYRSLDLVPSVPVAMVLGASVSENSVLSPILTKRAAAAVLLYKAHKVKKILVSGDNSSVSYNEVSTAGRYLLAAGIPQEDIFLDHAGFDTYSSMYRARAVFNVSSMVIVSQGFHLPRAIFLARSLGIQAYGFVAEGGGVKNVIREIPASDKAFLDIILWRMPRYIGTPLPITGNGQITWP